MQTVAFSGSLVPPGMICTVEPLNSIFGISHWRILAALLGRLSPDAQVRMRGYHLSCPPTSGSAAETAQRQADPRQTASRQAVPEPAAQRQTVPKRTAPERTAPRQAAKRQTTIVVSTAPSAVLATTKAKVPTAARSAIPAATSAKPASGGARPKAKTASRQAYSSEEPPGATPFIDSHMHLAMSCEQARKTMGKSGRRQSLDDLQRLCCKNSNIHVTHVITNYIFSRYWPDAKVHEDRDPMVESYSPLGSTHMRQAPMSPNSCVTFFLLCSMTHVSG